MFVDGSRIAPRRGIAKLSVFSGIVQWRGENSVKCCEANLLFVAVAWAKANPSWKKPIITMIGHEEKHLADDLIATLI